MGPLGHFTLTDGEVSRLFIGTGTGFAPLYFQIKALEQRKALSRTHFLFGVRTEDDVFLQEEIVRIQSENPNFSFEQYISRPKDASSSFRNGYVTEALTPEYIGQFQEFFIC
jgi:NAD(P)H-flavin reductase